MATTTTTRQSQTLDDLSTGYDVRRPEEVADFLEAYPFLVPLLLEARPVIARHFGAETPVVLRVSYDPEDDDLTQLVATILTNRPWEETRHPEERFGRDWWFSNLRRADGRLSIWPGYSTSADG